MCILLVEDEPIVREIAKEVLEEAGHEVVAAEHGQQACECINRHPDRFVCLLTDYHMPGEVNGGQVIEFMRLFYPTIPMVLVSGFPNATTAEWRKWHRIHRLDKPYSLGALVSLVERLLG